MAVLSVTAHSSRSCGDLNWPTRRPPLTVWRYGLQDCVGCSSVRACSSCMVEKTIAFYRAAATRFDARWVIKADDDVYLSPLRLPAAAAQWDRMGAEYVGCMKQGVVQNQPDHRWFEPAAVLLGTKYYMHGMGGVYVVAGNVVTDVLAPNAHLLRRLSFEGATFGTRVRCWPGVLWLHTLDTGLWGSCVPSGPEVQMLLLTVLGPCNEAA